MRKLFFLLMAAAVLLPVVSSCSDDSDEPRGVVCELPRGSIENAVVERTDSGTDVIVLHSDTGFVSQEGDTVYGSILLPSNGNFFYKDSKLSLPAPGTRISGIVVIHGWLGKMPYKGKDYLAREVKFITIHTAGQK